MTNPSSSSAHRLPLVDLGKQHALLRSELDQVISGVFESSEFILGPEVRAFEEEFGKFCGTANVVACANGTDALELALWGVGVKSGQEVITVAHTFAATAEAILRCGATPRFVDVAPDTLLMDIGQAERAINNKTAAIVPVHLYGSCVDMGALMRLARTHGLKVVEDAAQAHGAETTGGRAGTIGNAGCFSFYPGKNLGACGDAGAIVTSDRGLAARLRQARDHGRRGKYDHEFVGRNSRMDALQAAILRTKLRHLEGWNSRRREIAAHYKSRLSKIPEIRPVRSPKSGVPVHHLFVVQVDKRDQFRQHLAGMGISTGIHYPVPLHHQAAFASSSGSNHLLLPVTEAAATRVASLPIFPEMRDADIDRVINAIEDWFRTAAILSA